MAAHVTRPALPCATLVPPQAVLARKRLAAASHRALPRAGARHQSLVDEALLQRADRVDRLFDPPLQALEDHLRLLVVLDQTGEHIGGRLKTQRCRRLWSTYHSNDVGRDGTRVQKEDAPLPVEARLAGTDVHAADGAVARHTQQTTQRHAARVGEALDAHVVALVARVRVHARQRAQPRKLAIGEHPRVH
jgi:hypothetical protein